MFVKIMLYLSLATTLLTTAAKTALDNKIGKKKNRIA